MNELWIPAKGTLPDITNLFDMMEIFQDGIDSRADLPPDSTYTLIALRGLRDALQSLKADERRVGLGASVAFINSCEDSGVTYPVEDVCVTGDIQDVKGFLMKDTTVNLTFYMDVERIYKPGSLSEGELALTTGNIPFRHIEYIERVA